MTLILPTMVAKGGQGIGRVPLPGQGRTIGSGSALPRWWLSPMLAPAEVADAILSLAVRAVRSALAFSPRLRGHTGHREAVVIAKAARVLASQRRV